MYLRKLKLINFKNYEHEEFEFSTPITSFYGLNGMGKTNVLDAIYYTCLAKSYFTALDKNICKDTSDFFRIESSFEDLDQSYTVHLKIKPGSIKEVEINGSKVNKLSKYVGLLHVVLISPNDIYQLLSGNEARRNFINNIIVQYDAHYFESLVLYNKLLKNRNALLKDFNDKKYFDKDLLQIITEQMDYPAQYIFKARKTLFADLSPKFENEYQTIAQHSEKAAIQYRSQLEDSAFLTLCDQAMAKDRVTCRSSIGIHKDDIILSIDGKSLNDYGSQGQCKSYIFALKLSQLQLMYEKTDKMPILLLDDVLEKLDPQRIKSLLTSLQNYKSPQVFITDTHKGRVADYFQDFDINEIEISKGKIGKASNPSVI